MSSSAEPPPTPPSSQNDHTPPTHTPELEPPAKKRKIRKRDRIDKDDPYFKLGRTVAREVSMNMDIYYVLCKGAELALQLPSTLDKEYVLVFYYLMYIFTYSLSRQQEIFRCYEGICNTQPEIQKIPEQGVITDKLWQDRVEMVGLLSYLPSNLMFIFAYSLTKLPVKHAPTIPQQLRGHFHVSSKGPTWVIGLTLSLRVLRLQGLMNGTRFFSHLSMEFVGAFVAIPILTMKRMSIKLILLHISLLQPSYREALANGQTFFKEAIRAGDDDTLCIDFNHIPTTWPRVLYANGKEHIDICDDYFLRGPLLLLASSSKYPIDNVLTCGFSPRYTD
jgi:hypothetical protein